MFRQNPDESRAQSRFEMGNEQTATVPPELVRRVADKVYAQLLRDLQIERERYGRYPYASRYAPRSR